MIFIDCHVPMYLIGAPHAQKESALRWVEQAFRGNEALVTDAEVLQEILHRYSAINRREAIVPATDMLLRLVTDVFPVTRDDVLRARALMTTGARQLSARDAIHIAVMRTHGVRRIFTFDSDFDGLPDITREPM
jgi:uncharacterized protein